MGYKTFQYRLYPSRSQARNLRLILACARHWYNMCVEARKLAWEFEKHSITKNAQLQQVKHYKRTFPQAQQVHSHVLQLVAAKVDEAYQAFFSRIKAGKKPGYPRFKNWQRFRSFGFKEYGNGFKLDGRRLRIFGAGRIPVRWHRPCEGEIKTCQISCQAGRWYASLTCEISDVEPLPKTGHRIGIDVGVSALITTSDGEKVDNPRWYRISQAGLRRKQRVMSRAKKGSQNRKKTHQIVQRQHEKVVNQRADFLNKLIYRLIQTCDGIALEDLNIKNMIRNHHFSKSILDSGWGYFKQHLILKAGSAGREVAVVNPAYTSKRCSNCGALFQNFDLSTRRVECPCGLSLDRDHNAALNILNRAGWVTSVSQNVAPLLASQEAGKGKRATEAARLQP